MIQQRRPISSTFMMRIGLMGMVGFIQLLDHTVHSWTLQQKQERSLYHHHQSPTRSNMASNFFPKHCSQHASTSFRTKSTKLYQSDSNKNPDTIDTSSMSGSTTDDDLDPIYYQRGFYSFSPGSDVEIHQAIVVEERVRFVKDPDRVGYLQPIGPRTLILRDGQVADGEIGDAFYTIHLLPPPHLRSTGSVGNEKTSGQVSSSHNGVGNDSSIEAIIATILYLASNPSLCTGQVLEIASETGLAGLLGCIGAAYVNGDFKKQHEQQAKAGTDDLLLNEIFTISKEHDPLCPAELEKLTLTDEDPMNLELMLKYCQRIGMKKVMVEQLEWRRRSTIGSMGRSLEMGGGSGGGGRRGTKKEYRTIIASDVAYSYPEAKELARTVANRLEPLQKYLDSPTSSSDENKVTIPQFVTVCPEYRSDVTYLRNFLEKGYKMSTTGGYLKLEQLKFVYQQLPKDIAFAAPTTPTMGELSSSSDYHMYHVDAETIALDEMELELQSVNEKKYQSLLGYHHPEYPGTGYGEIFFPMETGEYDMSGGSSFLEPEPGASPW